MTRKYTMYATKKKTDFFFKNLKERDHVEELRVGGRLIMYGSSRNRVACYGLDLFHSG